MALLKRSAQVREGRIESRLKRVGNMSDLILNRLFFEKGGSKEVINLTRKSLV